jgi:Protein of unknown function DUF262
MSTNQEALGIDIITAVDQRIEVVRTQSLDLSFNELLDMYANQELIISPEYQRLFRWSEGKQSRLIESLILEMPLPPLFVIERAQGAYELIDGLQRLSSYIHFRGLLTHEDGGQLPGLTLSECDIVPELNGLTYDTLPRALAIKLKRAFVRVEVIRKESDPRLRYYMFKRLNTGGELASEQEIRNCTIRLLDPAFNDFVATLSRNEDFMTCIAYLSEEKRKEKYDQELVLRFFAFKNDMATYVHNIGDFLTEFMEKVSSGAVPFDYDLERSQFELTFRILRMTLSEHAFTGVVSGGSRPAQFLSLHYEAFALSLVPHLDSIRLDDPEQIARIQEVFGEIKRDDEFRGMTTGGGKNFRRMLERRIGFVTDAVSKVL